MLFSCKELENPTNATAAIEQASPLRTAAKWRKERPHAAARFASYTHFMEDGDCLATIPLRSGGPESEGAALWVILGLHTDPYPETETNIDLDMDEEYGRISDEKENNDALCIVPDPGPRRWWHPPVDCSRSELAARYRENRPGLSVHRAYELALDTHTTMCNWRQGIGLTYCYARARVVDRHGAVLCEERLFGIRIPDEEMYGDKYHAHLLTYGVDLLRDAVSAVRAELAARNAHFRLLYDAYVLWE